MFTLVRNNDRDQDPLFPIVPIPFPVPVTVLSPCSVNLPLHWHARRHVRFARYSSFDRCPKVKLVFHFLPIAWAMRFLLSWITLPELLADFSPDFGFSPGYGTSYSLECSISFLRALGVLFRRSCWGGGCGTMFVFLKRGGTSSDCDARLSELLFALSLTFFGGAYPPGRRG